ncbi:uncharacterized protein LOC110029329 [Phalaenopsis equestris]|uniref:uncharacterized protein LOC110029329 n=1 Tax=Phalaenopsis equestris TaxID=78828 RepID=UPI0009E389C5|nr:uncharacterized protein LOC110029329 [Phalaenopsis equestris]
MSVACGVECVVFLGCARWAWKRLTYVGSYDSESWPPASDDEIEPIPRLCRTILAVYEDDLSHPRFPPPSGYGMNPKCLLKRVPYEETQGRCPPYLIYADHSHREIILAVRGLNLSRESDYKVLLDNRLGMQMFDGGYVHHGLLKAATFILNRESELLRRVIGEVGEEYKLVFTGHSLGSGVVALMAVIVVNHRDRFGGIERDRIRCYAIAPARCMSLNLAVKYADVINSVVLQDDFLPRTPTPLEHIFGSIFCLPCFLFLVCLRDTFIPEKRKLNDPRRLYAPGRMYHIVERKVCRCGRFPPEVRTAIPVEGRFEHIVLSCNATSDHGLLWIERESQKLFNIRKEDAATTTAPVQQKMERKQTLEKEYKGALERAVTLNVPHANPPLEPTADEINSAPLEIQSETIINSSHSENQNGVALKTESKSGGRTNWDELVEMLFTRNESGSLVLKKKMGERES